MRCARFTSLGFLLLCLTGCLHDRPTKTASWFDRFGSGPTGPDAIVLEYAIIERPAGNPTINRDAWKVIDEQVLATETRYLLNENGLRAGLIGGLLPSELEGLLANPKSTMGYRRRRLYAGNPAVLTINPTAGLAEYQLKATPDSSLTTVRFEQARFSLSVTPEHSGDGRIKLKCVPEVEYQDKKHWLPPGAAGMPWLHSKPIERVASLGWELTLSPREYLVVGGINETGPKLGNQLFGGMNGTDKVHRLLIVRAGRLTPAEAGPDLTALTPGKDGIVPVASQASYSAVRGVRP
ncbi:MAG: hypothetical protein K8T89_25590 [Planctomycetes bacterium]|nr:hypothetical protein [Planctomycetota bacterium]